MVCWETTFLSIASKLCVVVRRGKSASEALDEALDGLDDGARQMLELCCGDLE